MKKFLLKVVLVASIFSITQGYELKRDKLGGDYRQMTTFTPGDCAINCYNDSRCKSYTFVKSTGKCYLKNTIPPSTYNRGCISGVSDISFYHVKQIVKAEGKKVVYWSGSTNLAFGADRPLNFIIAAVKRSGDAQLNIVIKKKVGGLANTRVLAMKNYLRSAGLPESKFNVRKIKRKDKRHKHLWLAKNKHMWVTVFLIR